MKSFSAFRLSMIVPMFGLLASLGAAACSGQAGTDSNGNTAVSQTEAVTAPAQGDKFAHGPRMHGPESLVFAALHESTITLTDAQRTTIQAAADTLKPKGPPPAQAGNKSALVAAVRAGQIDESKLATQMPAIDHTERSALVAKALTTLHATLTKEQRVALVAAVSKRAAEHKFDGPKHEGKGGPDGEKGPKGKHLGHGPMGMLEGLDLTADQQAAIKAKLDANKPAPPTDAEREAMKTQHEAMRKEMEARLQTFAADNFDATAFVAPPANAPKIGPQMHGGFVKDLAIIVPLLTPAQREKLAAKLEKGPPAPPAPPAPAAE